MADGNVNLNHIENIKDNLSAVLYKSKDLRLENRDVPEPKDNEVLIKMACVGICGSDIHYYVHGNLGYRIVNGPMVTGHEASGVVIKVGKHVQSLKKGDRVAIEPGVSCGICGFCKEGRYNLCSEMRFCASPPVDGNLCRYYTHAADFCHKLPDHVSFEEGALLEPLSVGVHACRRAGVCIGTAVLILGAGPIGLGTIITAKAMGANKVIITDVIEHRLTVAKEMGADFTVKVNPNDNEKCLAERIHDLLGSPPEITIDCSGLETTNRLGLEATKSGGVLVLVGVLDREVTVPLIRASCREIDIRGAFRYANDYPIALAMVASGKVNVKRLITHTFELEDTVEAFETFRTGAGNAIKVIIYCNDLKK